MQASKKTAGAIPAAAIAERRRGLIISTLGIIQIFAWGSTYYLPTVMAKPISAENRWPLPWVIGGLSLAMLIAGAVSPRAGRTIQSRGGRPVLAFSSAVLAAGLAWMAIANSLASYLAAWAIIGIGMATGLYDAAFATLGRLFGGGARIAITLLTLFGGFSSTVCWPLSALMLEKLGWRWACLAYAAFHLAIALPANLLAVPDAPDPIGDAGRLAESASEATRAAPPADKLLTSRELGLFALIAASVTLGSAVTSALSVHLLSFLQAQGRSLAAAVGLAALVGPSQVASRVYEFLLGRRFHPTVTFIAAAALMFSGLGVLLMAFRLAPLGLVLYGAGVGMMTIARGTIPLALFDQSIYPVLLGRLALPSLIAQAIAPPGIALMLERGGALRALTILVAVALANLAVVAGLRLLATRGPAERKTNAPRSDDREAPL